MNKTLRSDYQSLLPGVPRLLTVKETARALNVSEKTVRRWIAVGALVAHRLGRQLRISAADMESFIKAHRCPVL